MMMDDIINDKCTCPVCRQQTDWISLVWLNGECTCPTCYEDRRKEIDDEVYATN